MTDGHLPETYTPEITVSKLSRVQKVKLVALIAQFAPQSSVYSGNPPMKAATDDLIAKSADFDTKNKAASNAQQAFFTAVTARGTSEGALDNAFEVFKSNATTFCKSEDDLKNLGVSRKPTKAQQGPPVPLTPPVTVTAKPGKTQGAIDTRATRIPGLDKYILAISPNPIAANSFEVLPGTASKRTITGLVSGQQYWIRYCTERGQLRSDWSAPILVTAR